MKTRIEASNRGFKWYVSEGKRKAFYKQLNVISEYEGYKMADVKNVMVYTGLKPEDMFKYITGDHLITHTIGKTTYVFLTEYACDLIYRLRIYVDRNGTDMMFDNNED